MGRVITVNFGCCSPPALFRVAILIVVSGSAASPSFAQSPLTLSDAIARARANNPDAKAAAAGEREAVQRVAQARSGYLPKVDLAESWQRGTHPPFVFSARLAQRTLTADDFALNTLNHPTASNNFRTALSVEQPLFNRTTVAGVRAASIAREMATNEVRRVDQNLTAATTDAFGRVLIAAATARSAAFTVETARADRELARNRRDAGRVTDADVLQLDVYLARTLEQQVQANAEERIARATLNQLMGEPLSTVFVLDFTAPIAPLDIGNSANLEEEALKHRPDVALARQQQQMAAATVAAARGSFAPQAVAHGTWELNGGTLSSRVSSWTAGAVIRINLFNGLADTARLAAAREQAARRALETDHAETRARLDVQIAIARLEAARASEVVGRAAAERARESGRIVRDRYESGLVDVTVLLRSADDMQQADALQIAAHVNVLTATAHLQRAIGKP
jgi:outer membrane protein TolC